MIASPSTLAAVAVGGAVGSMARYLLMTAVGHWLGTQFPYGTLIVNAVGCFTMGALAELAALVWSPSPELRALLMVGVLGDSRPSPPSRSTSGCWWSGTPCRRRRVTSWPRWF
ncbi:CrcB family protein [Azospirillum brasilense]|uniref:CrcB family protein n=1 Tax=Azospirillum brasilense TaxID=192 RepID=UPI001FE697A6|nr:CrcB family protein [Azospirillum brasilense]